MHNTVSRFMKWLLSGNVFMAFLNVAVDNFQTTPLAWAIFMLVVDMFVAAMIIRIIFNAPEKNDLTSSHNSDIM